MPSDATTSPAPATVTASFSLPIGNTVLNARVQLPAGRTTLTDLLPIIQNLENAVVEKVSSEATAVGHPISCRAGCGACCRQMVPLSLFEAEALTVWLATLPEDRVAILRERFHRALSALSHAGVINAIVDGKWLLDDESSTQLAIDYFHAGVPCPFLENESCSIHPIRPLICREYLVTSSPELCKDPSVHLISGVRLPLRLSRAVYAIGRQLTKSRHGWIPLVFLLAWAEGGLKPGDFVSGPGPEVFQNFLNQVSAIANSDAAASSTPAAP
jgi:Fe-S-cluster containining protein